jgi:hypothetical protein
MSMTRIEDPFPLSDLQKETRQEEIYPRFPLSVLGLLAQTATQYDAETTFLRLLPAAIHAAPAFLDAKEDATALASIALLKKHPELLFIKKKVTDHYGREIWASPYQIFLGAGDIWALKQVHEEIIPKIENGEAQAKAQFKEQFPNYDKKLEDGMDEEARFYDDRNKQQIEKIVKQLTTVKQLIDVDPFNNNEPLDATKQAIETLCKLFQPAPAEVIRSGLHFPLAIIKKIYETYDALQGDWSFFSLAVIKPALDALSTVDGQCCQHGLINLDMEKGPNRRCHSSYQHPLGQPLSLTLVNDKDGRGHGLVDPYDGNVLFVSSTPGYLNYFNKNGAGLHGMGGGWLSAVGVRCGWPLKNLWRAKAVAYSSYYAAVAEKHNRLRQCVIF